MSLGERCGHPLGYYAWCNGTIDQIYLLEND